MAKSKVGSEGWNDHAKEVAKYVKDHGGDPCAAVKHFNLSILAVTKACNEHGVKFRQYPIKLQGSPDEESQSVTKTAVVYPRTAQITEDLLAGVLTQTQIARKYKVTRAWVSLVWQRLKRGIKEGTVQLKPRRKPEFPWQTSHLTTPTPYQFFLLGKLPRKTSRVKRTKTKK